MGLGKPKLGSASDAVIQHCVNNMQGMQVKQSVPLRCLRKMMMTPGRCAHVTSVGCKLFFLTKKNGLIHAPKDAILMKLNNSKSACSHLSVNLKII